MEAMRKSKGGLAVGGLNGLVLMSLKVLREKEHTWNTWRRGAVFFSVAVE